MKKIYKGRCVYWDSVDNANDSILERLQVEVLRTFSASSLESTLISYSSHFLFFVSHLYVEGIVLCTHGEWRTFTVPPTENTLLVSTSELQPTYVRQGACGSFCVKSHVNSWGYLVGLLSEMQLLRMFSDLARNFPIF